MEIIYDFDLWWPDLPDLPTYGPPGDEPGHDVSVPSRIEPRHPP